jgi:signal transduction histidine kinase
MNIATFITYHMEEILVEWEEFAMTFGAAADKMSSLELRDHAKEILEFVARDIQEAQTEQQTEAKSKGHGPEPTGNDTASMAHGKLRYASGFTLQQLIAEYRALRASVLKLWEQETDVESESPLRQVMRFNEAIDQSLAEAAVAYSKKVDATRDIFLAILGHDLRSPLAATATAGIYLSRPGGFEEKVQQVGGRVKRSAATMNGMVNDLLELARTQLGDGIPIQLKECDLLEMCHWAIEDANAAHPQAKFDLDASGELIGVFDRARLQQVVTNLANNAAQYGTPGKTISIKVTGEAERVLIQVKNEGPAIPKEALPKLFTSLVQLSEHEGDARPRGSLGLGLFIAKQITVAHGGSIHVESDDVNGTMFTAEIPRSQVFHN